MFWKLSESELECFYGYYLIIESIDVDLYRTVTSTTKSGGRIFDAYVLLVKVREVYI